MLTTSDPRFFNSELQDQLVRFIDRRQLFSLRLLELADEASDSKGLPLDKAEELLDLATGAFELSDKPVDYEWYKKLEKISAVAADIGGVPSTHINHLTPRVLDIDELYTRMQARGIKMIDEIQGPPQWEGPDVLLRQTSFRALGEDRIFQFPDGRISKNELRVRFGEVEARGIALSARGRELYDAMVAAVDERLRAATPGTARATVAREVWDESLPRTEHELADRGLAYFTYDLDPKSASKLPFEPARRLALKDLIRVGVVVRQPIVYEDFLPRSAAGIFQSNLTEDGLKDDALAGTDYDIDRMSEILGLTVRDPNTLYAEQQSASVSSLARKLGVDIVL